jgi:general secretion pathway protein L
MTLLHTIREVFARWTDTVAVGIVAVLGRFVSPPMVRLVEEDEKAGTFALQAEGNAAAGEAGRFTFAHGRFSGSELAPFVNGRRVEIVLLPNHFLVRPLELPARAGEFIEGIVRAQIDRLTPWSAGEAVFGCSPPANVGNDKIVTTIAATARATTEPYIAGLSALHPASVSIFTRATDETRDLIKVFEHQARGLLDRSRLSRLLRVVLAGAAAAAVLSTVVGALVGDYLDSRRAELNGELVARRLALRLNEDSAERSPDAALVRRKHETQASVIVLEELSRILPDHTYVTGLHIDGNTLQVVGITDDAPSLIRLMEQSSHFSRATFFAPTTRAASDQGDHFHLEAKLEPINTVGR